MIDHVMKTRGQLAGFTWPMRDQLLGRGMTLGFWEAAAIDAVVTARLTWNFGPI